MNAKPRKPIRNANAETKPRGRSPGMAAPIPTKAANITTKKKIAHHLGLKVTFSEESSPRLEALPIN